jgi:hypothetical protein
MKKEDPPCPRERHMCCPVSVFGGDSFGKSPAVLIFGGMGGAASYTFKGLFLGLAGSRVLPPDPHVLVLQGLAGSSELSGDTGSGSSGGGGQNSGGSSDHNFRSSHLASSSQHGQHRSLMGMEAAGEQGPSAVLEDSGAASRTRFGTFPKGFWIQIPRMLSRPLDKKLQILVSSIAAGSSAGNALSALGSAGSGGGVSGGGLSLSLSAGGSGSAGARGNGAGSSGSRGGIGASSNIFQNLPPGALPAIIPPELLMLDPQIDILPDLLPRREASVIRLKSGHVVVFGGNDGRFVDVVGDGGHQVRDSADGKGP